MTDSALYTSTVSGKNILSSLRQIANNLANVNTVGFHADYETLVSQKITGNIMQTRVAPVMSETYTDFKSGPITYTGRELDVAIDGPGFIAVQSKTGQAGYTRAGSFQISPQGLLITNKGDLVLGTNGIITIPPASSVSIDKQGVVSARLSGESGTTLAEIGRIKLVELPFNRISKGEDGLYYPVGESNATVSSNVTLIPESIEGSNVDAIRSLTELVEFSRQFDMHTKQMKMIEDNAMKANRLFEMQG